MEDTDEGLNKMAWKESLRDRWILANRPPSEIRFIYCDADYWGDDALSWEALRQYRKGHRDSLLLLKGTKLNPEFTSPENERERVKKQRKRIAPKTGGAALKLVSMQIPEEHVPFHEKLQEALDSDGVVQKATFTQGEHTGYIKNSDNEIEYTKPLERTGIKFEVNFDTEPQWPIPTRVESVVLKRQERKVERENETCFIFPDIQHPFEDTEALAVALNVMQEVQPDRVVFLGDLIDLEAWGRFEQMPEWATATQDSINKVHQLLASIRQALPEAQIQVMAGNHEERMPKTLLRNAVASYRLKRADQLEGWPVMSVPFLCAFDQLDVEYVPGYPANKIWLNKNLQIRHGMATQKAGGAAKRTASAEKVSTIFGHDHRLSQFAETIDTHDGGMVIRTFGSGTLSRIDGHVPSYHSGRDLDGVPVRNLENWQHGFCIATYDQENFHVEQVAINTFNDYQTMFRGHIYKP